MTLISVLCLMLALGGVAEPVSDRVVLTLSTDRDSYYLGEPLQLTVTAENRADVPIKGYFVSRPYHDTVEIEYRRVGQPFVRFEIPLAHAEEINVKRVPTTLGPGENATSELVLSFDPNARRFVLADAGEYELRVAYRATPGNRKDLLVSNTVTVRVEAPPPHEEEAFNLYAKGSIALLPQFDPLSSEVDPGVILEAAELIDRYPASPYANAARAGLLRVLRHKVVRNQATERQRELYETLKRERPPKL